MNRSIQKMFNQISDTYSIVNHVLTIGMDNLWRKKAAKSAACTDGNLWLDVCCGTGEMTMCLSKLSKKKAKVIAIDFSLPMMRKAMENSNAKQIVFTQADVTRLPFQNNTFDVITISFATRNLNVSSNNLSRCLGEFYRVLKSGGQFINLETSQPKINLIRTLFHLYVKSTVKPIGSLISGNNNAYNYLSSSMQKFYDPYELSAKIKQSGFTKVTFKRLMFGAVAIHQATK